MIDITKLHHGKINVPTNGNSLLETVLKNVNENKQVTTLWIVNNVNAIDRIGYSDHGYTHFQIVANIALRITRLLHKRKIVMSITENYGLSQDYAEVIVFLASVLHDIGMSINREGHEELSLFLAYDILKDILSFLSIEERTILTADILHAILSHRSDGKPVTIEAGIVRIADALDMSQGRSRIPFEAGKVNIHSISAYAIEHVDIKEGIATPVEIAIHMNNSSGIFQVDELLKKKLLNSGIQKYFEIKAETTKTEKNLIQEFTIQHTG